MNETPGPGYSRDLHCRRPPPGACAYLRKAAARGGGPASTPFGDWLQDRGPSSAAGPGAEGRPRCTSEAGSRTGGPLRQLVPVLAILHPRFDHLSTLHPLLFSIFCLVPLADGGVQRMPDATGPRGAAAEALPSRRCCRGAAAEALPLRLCRRGSPSRRCRRGTAAEALPLGRCRRGAAVEALPLRRCR